MQRPRERVNTLANRQVGQSMTEFLICAVYVLVPLFLMVPLLGKYIDIKHATIQAARYEAWEYTVWQNKADDHDILDNFAPGGSYEHPFKTPTETRAEALRRVMAKVGTETDTLPVADDDKTNGWTEEVRNGLWRDHRRLALYDGDLVNSDYKTSEPTPALTLFGLNVGSLLNQILGLFDLAFGAVGAVIDFLDQDGASPKFSAINTDGLVTTNVTVPVAARSNVVDFSSPLAHDETSTAVTLDFSAKAAVLSEGWNAGGTEHTFAQAAGGAPSTLVKEILTLPVLGEMWDLVSFIAPELTRCKDPDDLIPPSPFAAPDGSLWLGYVDGDVVHPDRLSDPDGDPDVRLGSHECDDSGRCDWDATVDALNPTLSHSPCIP